MHNLGIDNWKYVTYNSREMSVVIPHARVDVGWLVASGSQSSGEDASPGMAEERVRIPL